MAAAEMEHLLLKLKYKDLKELAAKHEISTKGRKDALAERLLEKLSSEAIRKFYTEKRGLKIDIAGHWLVPEHRIMKNEEVEALLKEKHCNKEDLPKILDTDPMVLFLGAKAGDVLEIKRNSPTAGISYYYRVVVKAF